jgi:uncharacterized protein YqfA (UPF0365 family)
MAWQQEMEASVTESRAILVLAEVEIPAALAQAFRAGQLHVRRSPIHRTKPVEENLRIAGRIAPVALAPVVSSNRRSIEAWETEGGACA